MAEMEGPFSPEYRVAGKLPVAGAPAAVPNIVEESIRAAQRPPESGQLETVAVQIQKEMSKYGSSKPKRFIMRARLELDQSP
jgi:hypothetical protein